MKYQSIDHLLLKVNKGPAQAIGPAGPVFPRPGDSVMVSTSTGRLISILIHRAESNNLVFKGKTTDQMNDDEDRKIIDSGAHVILSYDKIAGINRR